LDAFHRAIAEFAVTGLDPVIEPPALAAARQWLDSPGPLLPGEIHGAGENPLLIQALMNAFGLTSLALEWPEGPDTRHPGLAGQPNAGRPPVAAGRRWPDHRRPAGSASQPRRRRAAGTDLADGILGAGRSWSQRDEATARRIPAISPPSARTLVAAGNARTPVSPTEPGVPMGARAAGQRPGTREVQISYGGGRFYNRQPHQFARRTGPQATIRLHQHQGELVPDLPAATEAVVPHRPLP
jgi:hypothetical protein